MQRFALAERLGIGVVCDRNTVADMQYSEFVGWLAYFKINQG